MNGREEMLVIFIHFRRLGISFFLIEISETQSRIRIACPLVRKCIARMRSDVCIPSETNLRLKACVIRPCFHIRLCDQRKLFSEKLFTIQ